MPVRKKQYRNLLMAERSVRPVCSFDILKE